MFRLHGDVVQDRTSSAAAPGQLELVALCGGTDFWYQQRRLFDPGQRGFDGRALGTPMRLLWPEIRNVIGPMMQGVVRGQAGVCESQRQPGRGLLHVVLLARARRARQGGSDSWARYVQCDKDLFCLTLTLDSADLRDDQACAGQPPDAHAARPGSVNMRSHVSR